MQLEIEYITASIEKLEKYKNKTPTPSSNLTWSSFVPTSLKQKKKNVPSKLKWLRSQKKIIKDSSYEPWESQYINYTSVTRSVTNDTQDILSLKKQLKEKLESLKTTLLRTTLNKELETLKTKLLCSSKDALDKAENELPQKDSYTYSYNTRAYVSDNEKNIGNSITQLPNKEEDKKKDRTTKLSKKIKRVSDSLKKLSEKIKKLFEQAWKMIK